MFHDIYPKTWNPWILLLILISGCDEEEARVAREAADRQAQQNTVMAELHQEVASGTQRLIEADAQARKEVVGVHRDLQAERSRLDTGWSALEQERKQIANQRQTESILAPAIQYLGAMALAVVLLGFCWRALVASHRSEHTDGQLTELLVSEILPGEPSLLIGDGQRRLLNQLGAGDQHVD